MAPSRTRWRTRSYFGAKHNSSAYISFRFCALQVAIISSAATEEERVLETNLGAAAADAEANGVKPPAIIVIGAIAALRRTLIHGMTRGP